MYYYFTISHVLKEASVDYCELLSLCVNHTRVVLFIKHYVFLYAVWNCEYLRLNAGVAQNVGYVVTSW